MDLEDEAMPYLKLLNENSGNYLIQNSYELQDCLSVEPIFTEMETGTWSPECFPILLNGSAVDNNIRGVTDNIAEKAEGHVDDNNSNRHIISQLRKSEETFDITHQKENIPSSSGLSQNVILSQDSMLRSNTKNQNLSSGSQQGKQKRAFVLCANGNTYEISYSNDKMIDSIELQDINVNSETLDNINEDTVNGNEQIIQIVTPEEHTPDVEDQGDNSLISDNQKDPDPYDLSDWNEFHCVVTARKCKVCSFLCESLVEMNDHLNRAHRDLVEMKQASEETESGKSKLKMRSLLDTNTSKEKNVTIFLCSTCNNIFETKELLMEHVKIHNNEEPSISDENQRTNELKDKPVNSMRNLATSLLKKQQKAMKKLKCSIKGCTLKFSNDETKLRHEGCHVPNMKHFQCPECKEEFSVWRVCSKHLWTSHMIDAGLYTCSICDKYKSISTVAVINHMDIHNTEKPFLCPDCGKGFKQLNQLRNHRVIHNRAQELSSLSSTRCTICERTFANRKSLKIHIQSVHEKFKPYVCDVCGHKTSRKAMLELHLRLHTGDKPHHCPHCSYRTGDSNCLRKHVMKHYGYKKYSCPYCEYQAIQSSAYKSHLINKHPEADEIFKCSYCTFTTVKFESYLTHVKCHEYDEEKNRNDDPSENTPSPTVETEENETQVDL
ncbi:myoneurin-like [Coccinella septempunctata]|uniref:myoneurin-like n=1 Tax=Coccinella septempunctata TaxID=41139 RepID=UPI001D078F5C|nr:myoneurin-like [Coccinella septempunctata]